MFGILLIAFFLCYQKKGTGTGYWFPSPVIAMMIVIIMMIAMRMLVVTNNFVLAFWLMITCLSRAV